ncbi:hypothetical protein IQ07DRAFT_597923 [Pyrenochaeta sp. DS3sAY3a]|nr:hypothetical protein IQ07DRAFT_597923 [Pyrenochaeta sp. DS3sAY3a]
MANDTFLRYNSCSPLIYVFVAFASVAIWSTIPLTIRLLTTLKRRSGLYFWSILITSWGLSIRQIGFVVQFLAPSRPWHIALFMSQVGWIAMVSGFSIVLYSRLNIILESWKTRRAVLAMIVFNGVVWHVAMATLSAGIATERNTGHPERIAAWQAVMHPMERVQIVMFSAQEIVISFFYVRAAYQYLQSRYAQKGKTRSAMFLLLLVQIVIIAADIALIVIDLAGYLQLKLFIHSFVYAVKLELEFVVLNQLLELSQMGVPGIPSFSFPVSSRGVADAGNGKGPRVMVAVDEHVPAMTSDLELQRTVTPKCSLDFITKPHRIASR